MKTKLLSLTSYRRVTLFRYFTKSSSPPSSLKNKFLEEPPDSRFPWLEKIKFNTFLEKFIIRPNFVQRMSVLSAMRQIKAAQLEENYKKNITTVSLKYYDDMFADDPVYRKYVDPMDQRILDTMEQENYSAEDQQFPYKIYTKYSKVEPKAADEKEELDSENVTSSTTSDDDGDGSNRTEMDLEGEIDDDASWVHDYGTPNPNIPQSQVPCGGCGAHLHCQETAIPGYIPSERFRGMSDDELRTQICQRCYFLKIHDTALNVNVHREVYPEILSHIKTKRALVLLLVDLTDFPCSIWPGIVDIIGPKRPVILIGNKVDLIPRDSKNYLQHIKECLKLAADNMGLNKCKIVDTHLISAFTGYGIENLISTIFEEWGVKGDIYIMGCTNVGKSTLFNVFLQSDLCKLQVQDLVQRATISAWPGTTLNLLKFPVLVPEGWKISVRSARMRQWYELEEEEKKMREYQLRESRIPAYATLVGRVDRSFKKEMSKEELNLLRRTRDEFKVDPYDTTLPPLSEVGKWNPDDRSFASDTWCYDTPGTVNENQILDLLSLPELMKVTSRKLIQPRSYVIKLGMTLFVGGIIRIDFVEGELPIRYTVFTSTALPVTIVCTEDADEIYGKALGTPILGVPMGGKQRLSKFPKLQSRDFEMEGMGLKYSCADIVISGAGWVAVTAQNARYCRLRVHTPNGAGMFCRSPSLLPYMINLRGGRIKKTYAYGRHTAYVPSAGNLY